MKTEQKNKPVPVIIEGRLTENGFARLCRAAAGNNTEQFDILLPSPDRIERIDSFEQKKGMRRVSVLFNTAKESKNESFAWQQIINVLDAMIYYI